MQNTLDPNFPRCFMDVMLIDASSAFSTRFKTGKTNRSLLGGGNASFTTSHVKTSNRSGRTLEMDSTTSKRPSATQSPLKSGTKKKVLSAASRESKRKYDKSRSGTRICIGYALEEWRLLQLDLSLKKDADMAHFLVCCYRKKQAPETAIQGVYVRSTSTPSKRTAAKMSHRLSPIEPVSEGEDFLMAGVEALADDLDLDPFEESFKSMDLATDAVQIDEDQANNLLNSVLRF
ncbi:transcript variant X2 [Nothobranchius furzeri]|uniref:Transcript variant X2 n=1 Tax=Nothobranchius furzeri TaxID=105023 RepID=A0A9D2YIA0_NOTFU|nr:transcript variant X2 [Nothobranchius furzeri]